MLVGLRGMEIILSKVLLLFFFSYLQVLLYSFCANCSVRMYSLLFLKPHRRFISYLICLSFVLNLYCIILITSDIFVSQPYLNYIKTVPTACICAITRFANHLF